MEIHVLSTSKLVPYSRQLRKNDHAVAHMAASINEYGFKIPVLARSDGAVVDGDLRLKAAHKALSGNNISVQECFDIYLMQWPISLRSLHATKP